MNASIWCAAAILGAAFALIALERRWPYQPRQKLFRPGFAADLFLYGAAQSWVLGVGIAWLLGWMDRALGPRPLIAGAWPLVAQVVFFTVLHDLYIYWFHRAQHQVPLLWRIHAAHHSTRDVDWLSGTRSHALEILINQTIEFAPLVLLGASPEVAVIKGAVSAIWGMFIHSNLDVRLGALRWLFNGPELHRWHHALEIENGRLNFGTKLAIWDWLFGTARTPAGKPRGYGIFGADYPTSFVAQLIAVVRRVPPNPSRGAG